ncbi:hypothetical protein B0H10DRAFT_802417 [Mycena sp. CBHHK59/15]|nr:hypothetical protein B0H10DRAFT_802417 [Mycena sp. CBHHK59/15]
MDVDEYDGGTAGESQTSQLLKNVLELGSEEESPMCHTIPADTPDVSKEDSMSSFRNSHSAPQYHYHGLATTQTQSQQYDDDDDSNFNEGSQKENVKSSRETLSSSGNQLQAPLHVPPPVHSVKAPLVGKASHSPTKVTTNTKAVSFESPRVVTPIKPAEVRSTARPLVRTTPARKREPSQDSFAGDFGDPAERFIASSKKFDTPLAVLALVPSLSVDGSPETTRSAMFARTFPSLSDRDPAPQGKILVASTPSNSEPQIEPQSQEFEGHRQPEDYSAITPLPEVSGSQTSTQYASSEPSFSYDHLYGNLTPDLEPTQILEPTQLVEELEPTQLIEQRTQTVIQSDSETTDGEEEHPTGEGYSDATNTTGHTKTLLDSLDQRKRNRYAAHLGRTPRNFPADDVLGRSTNAIAAEPFGLQDTQPAFEQALPPARPAPSPSNRPPSKAKNSTASRFRQATIDDRMEVIPDSEPAREGSPLPVSPSKPATKSPTKPRRRVASSDTETDAEVIPDSMQVDDEDGDEVVGILNAKHSVREEEEEEEGEDVGETDDQEEEEEVPLAKATTRANRAAKGKEKAAGIDSPTVRRTTNQSRTATESPLVVPKRNQKRQVSPPPPNPTRKRRVRNQSPEVPSSVPHQDLPTTKPKVATKGKSAAATRVRKNAGGSTRRKAADEREESSDDELLMPKSEKDEEVETELAEDEYTHAQVGVAGPSTRKRKRSLKADSPEAQPQLKSRRKVAKALTHTSSTRLTKRRRGASTSTHAGFEPTRVFAMWRPDGHYYSGVVHSLVSGTTYRVKFDDGNLGDIKLDQMRVYDIRIGDAVLFGSLRRGGEVADILNLDKDKVVVQANDSSTELDVSRLRITPRCIAQFWADRMITAADSIVFLNPPKPETSPTPSRASVISAASSICSDLFSKIGFVITHGGNESRNEEKERVATCVRNNSGIVVDDWEDIISMKGKQTNNRWILEQKDAVRVAHGLQGVFLLSDDANQKPKFLLALALGVPCVSVDWLYDSITERDEQEWMAYLLPSGFSDCLGVRVTQRVNADWGSSAVDVSDIINNPAAFKVFKGKTILCIGADVVLAPKGKKNANGVSIPRIILAMGARSVEAVREVKHASRALSSYDYIMLKEEDLRIPSLEDCTIVSWTWVKDALISGCIPPLEGDDDD